MKGEAQTVPWRVWNKYNILRHSFLAWLLAHDRLRTRDRLMKAGVDVCGFVVLIWKMQIVCFFNVSIVICVNSDSVTGLAFTVGLLRRLALFGGNGEGRNCKSRVQRQIVFSCLAALVYHLWFARSRAYWDAALMTPVALIKRVQFDVCTRVQQLIGRKWTEADRCWFDMLKSAAT